MTQEIWKDVVGFEGLYEVSNLGNVKSLSRKYSPGENILKPASNNYGYIHVGLSRGNKLFLFKVHKLVAMAFLNHTPNGHKLIIDHINHKKDDNRLENLQIITHKENVNRYHAYKNQAL